MGATLLNVRLWHRYFCVKFTKFVKTYFLQSTSPLLPLFVYLVVLMQKKGIDIWRLLNINSFLKELGLYTSVRFYLWQIYVIQTS